jgi:hypothetical protein
MEVADATAYRLWSMLIIAPDLSAGEWESSVRVGASSIGTVKHHARDGDSRSPRSQESGLVSERYIKGIDVSRWYSMASQSVLDSRSSFGNQNR